MSLYAKVILCIFALAYLISPVDIIPDILLPYIGWLDDGVIIATIIYMIRYGRLPDFIFKKNPLFRSAKQGTNSSAGQSRTTQETRSREKEAPNRNSTDHAKKNAATPKSPYEILGLTPGATKRQIQTAYKTAIKKYHPDKLSHLGEEFSTLANEKFLEIQKAYDALMKHYR